MTQKEALLIHFINGNSLSTIEATKRSFGYCTKLPARISEYCKLGFIFDRKKIVKKSIFGQPVYFFEYKLNSNTPKKLIDNFKKSVGI